MHLFAVGNSGDDNCNIYPNGHGTIIQSYATSKNILAVGATYHRGGLTPFSSKGPTQDGRIKPEIVTPGDMVKSTGDANDYFFASGTSMATASATGDLALLTEYYKNLNGGENPRGDLLKAIAANTATDHGAAGPDYSYGFGALNAKRAAGVIKNNQYIFGEISHIEDANYVLHIPANAYEVKVMLYWHDIEGNLAVTKSLVNDLDLSVTSNGLTYRPWVLDHRPANVELPATRKVDTLNNIEQVSISGNELNGNQITVNIQGTNIPEGAQKYVLVYDIIMPEVTITYPAGGEDFIPNFRKEIIRWDAFGPNADDVNIEYSFDNGNTWTEIPTNADNHKFGYVDWVVPGYANTSVARIRAIIPGTNKQHVSKTFQVLPIATGLRTEVICQDQARFSWNAIPQAVEYEILRLDTFMKVVGRTTDKSMLITGLLPNEANYFTVRGIREDGSVGPKGVSIKVIPAGTNCTSISDVGVAAIVSPIKNGRQFTSLSLANRPISVKLSNYGNVPVSNFPVNFQINGGTVVTEIFTGTIAPGESSEFTFTSIDPNELEAVKEYTLDAWTGLSGDAKVNNNAVPNPVVVNQFANPAISAADFPYHVNFDQATICNMQDNFIGMNGNQIVDYNTSGPGGRLRVSDNADLNAPGSTKVLTLDATYPISGTVTNELILTYNLADLNGNLQELGFQFSYMQHQQEADPTNRVFARGSDTDAWVEIFNLYDNQPSVGEYKDVDRMDILPVLTAEGQAVSSSFQLKFCQTGRSGAEETYNSDGYTFDNIRIDDGVSLPVELAYFEAEKNGNNAILKWSTLTELNNRHFHVEFANGEEGGEIGEWQLLEMVRGAGTTTKAQYYQVIDKRLDKTTYRYYRLRQIDYDGTSVYSDVKVVNFKNAMIKMEVFPNPTVESVNIKVIGAENSAINIQISDITGKVYDTIERPATNAEQRIETIELGEKYPEGYYVVSLFVGETAQSYKIYKSPER